VRSYRSPESRDSPPFSAMSGMMGEPSFNLFSYSQPSGTPTSVLSPVTEFEKTKLTPVLSIAISGRLVDDDDGRRATPESSDRRER